MENKTLLAIKNTLKDMGLKDFQLNLSIRIFNTEDNKEFMNQIPKEKNGVLFSISYPILKLSSNADIVEDLGYMAHLRKICNDNPVC